MMEYPVNFEALTETVEYYEEVVKMNERASAYLESFDWCKDITDNSLYLNLGSTICVGFGKCR